MTRGASSVARQEALRRLVAADPTLLEAVTLGVDPEGTMVAAQSTANMKGGRRSKVVGVTLFSEASGSSRTNQPAAVMPIVLLDQQALDSMAQSDTQKEVHRFDSTSSLQFSSSCSSSASLRSPSSRAAGDCSSLRRERVSKTPAPGSCRPSVDRRNSFSTVSDGGDASERGGKRGKPTAHSSGIPLSKSRSRELIDWIIKGPEPGMPKSESFNSLPRGASEQSDNNTSEGSEYEGSCDPLASEASVEGSGVQSSCMVLDHRCFVSRDQWVAHRARKACFVCMREFSMLRKRHSCRMCGDVICSRCSVFKLVDLPVVDNKLRVCSSCFVAYRKKLEDAGDKEQLEEQHGDDNNDERCEEPPSSSKPLSYVLLEPNTMALVSQPMQSNREPSGHRLDASVAASTTLSPSCSSSDVASMDESVTSLSISTASFSSDWAWADSSISIIDANAVRGADDELEAAIRAKQLEREVEASQQRIQLLESQIADQENQKDLLSHEQQAQLREARATIQSLQEKLRRQEASAREAAHTRDSICLQNLHKMRLTELHADDDSDESAALRKRLKVVERQLQQAGISVAEVIPYDVAKRKVGEISRRLQELGSSDVSMSDKSAQAAARKEYFLLEQEMEKYHTALLLTDEYIDEQRRKEQAWEAANRESNEAASKLLWSAIPVDISQLSERELVERPTPTGVKFPNELARRLKRTNVLQLMRVDPQTIVKMHPSVIEAYRTTGLALVERRALHHVMQVPFREWQAQQQADEMARRKFGWYRKLKDALALAIDAMDKHLASSDRCSVTEGSHACDLIGLACPERSDDKMRALYGAGFGFPNEPQFLRVEILKGDPDRAGEKAQREAEHFARDASVVAQARKRELQAHYGARNVRELTLALAALEETDVLLSRVRQQDAAFPVLSRENGAMEAASESLLLSVRELALALVKRAGISLSGKRDMAAGAPDTRSRMEVASASAAVAFAQLVLSDVADLFAGRWPVGLQRAFATASELLDDVAARSTAVDAAAGRTAWRDRVEAQSAPSKDSNQPKSPPAATAPTSSSMFDAIRARRRNARDETESPSPSNTGGRPPLAASSMGRPSDMLAAIRVRKTKLEAGTQ